MSLDSIKPRWSGNPILSVSDADSLWGLAIDSPCTRTKVFANEDPAMASQPEVPCNECRRGLHRICNNPVSIPTIYAYVTRGKGATTETLTCCDRKAFWTKALYP